MRGFDRSLPMALLRAREQDFLPAQGHDFRSVVELVRCGPDFVSMLDLDRVTGVSDV